MTKPLDLAGLRFGRLVALYRAASDNSGKAMWVCQCDCGETTTVASGNLKRGLIKSCGCYKKETFLAQNTTHGRSKSKEYTSWQNIKSRCFNHNNPDYAYYGAKGITMWGEWKNSFEAFYAHIGAMPSGAGEWSCERIDNSKGYEPGNVRWATRAEQARNRNKRVDNSSGVTGVIYRANRACYDASWTSADGKHMSKSFSARKYGYDEAFRLACEYRAKMIIELNQQGAGYTDSHGH